MGLVLSGCRHNTGVGKTDSCVARTSNCVASSCVVGGAGSSVVGGAGSCVVGGYIVGGAGSSVVGGAGSCIVGGAGSSVVGGAGSCIVPSSLVVGGTSSSVVGGAGRERKGTLGLDKKLAGSLQGGMEFGVSVAGWEPLARRKQTSSLLTWCFTSSKRGSSWPQNSHGPLSTPPGRTASAAATDL